MEFCDMTNGMKAAVCHVSETFLSIPGYKKQRAKTEMYFLRGLEIYNRSLVADKNFDYIFLKEINDILTQISLKFIHKVQNHKLSV